MNIDVFTVIGPNSKYFAEFAKYTMDLLKSKNHNINYFCLQNNNHKLPNGWINLESYNADCYSSGKHAIGLNKIIHYVKNDTDFVVIIDTDIAILLKDWDQICIDILNNTKCGIVGVDSGRISNGFYHKRYANFPCVFFHMVPKDIFVNIRCDYTPTYKGSFIVDSQYLSVINGLPMGEILFTDTGFQMPFVYKEKFYNGNCFFMSSKEQSKLKSFFDKNGLNLESIQEFYYGDKPIITHLGMGSDFDMKNFDTWKNSILSFIKSKHINL